LAINANRRALLHAFAVEASDHHVSLFRVVMDPGDVESPIGRRSRGRFSSVNSVCRDLNWLRWRGFVVFRSAGRKMFTSREQQ
jgi:hypothetical protein